MAHRTQNSKQHLQNSQSSIFWYAEYWNFTIALRFAPEDFWWYNFVIDLEGGEYLEDLECECALTNLTSASYDC